MSQKFYLSIAASVVVTFALTTLFFTNQKEPDPDNKEPDPDNTVISDPVGTDSKEQLSLVLNEIKKSNQQLNLKIDNNQKQITSLSNRLDELIDSEIDNDKPNPDDFQNDESSVTPIQREKELYDSEVVDFSWAPKAEADLESGLNSMGKELGFSLLEATCKTTRCMATISFSDYESAARDANKLVENIIPGLNCGQTISIPKPQNINEKYETALLLDCGLQVLGKTDPVY